MLVRQGHAEGALQHKCTEDFFRFPGDLSEPDSYGVHGVPFPVILAIFGDFGGNRGGNHPERHKNSSRTHPRPLESCRLTNSTLADNLRVVLTREEAKGIWAGIFLPLTLVCSFGSGV